MTGSWRRWLFPALFLEALLCAGCHIGSWPYFLGLGDFNLPPQLKDLAPADQRDKDKEVKVLILAHAGEVTQPEFVTAERDLAGMLGKSLQEYYRDHKQKVLVVPPGQVNRYKDSHPDWHLDLQQAGKSFNADYLVYLDVESLSLYEKGNLFYRGRADIHVSVIDLRRPDDEPDVKDYHGEYPEGAPVPVEDRNPVEFRRAFLSDVAKHLSWYFIRHPPPDEYALSP